MKLKRQYNAELIEPKWQRFWKKNKIYDFNLNSKEPIYSIDVPPPYASAGHLHVGHALHYTQFEIIARFKRMQGYNVYFAPCFDNNGLPTEKYVEDKFKVDKSNITRAEFRKLCLEESKKVEKAYADKVFRLLGHSYDWSLLYTTIDPEAQNVAQISFIDLYEKGDCYRAEQPTIWCTKHQTALAQAEVEDLNRTATLNYINFDLENGKKISIATTRPEFLPACVAILVNPKDKQNKNLIGKKAIVPISKQKVPIMKDDRVNMDFGSGIVMVCTFGDTTDIEWWKKYKLPLKIIVDKAGRLNKLAGKFEGLKLEEGKRAILEELKKQNRITKQENLQQTIGSCWRCNTPIEYIVTKQWFIQTLKYKKDLIKQGRKIKWYPSFYRVRYEDWTNNLAWDWCISRQRFYGVPVPVWYCNKCDAVILPNKKDLPIDPIEQKPNRKCKCGSDSFTPDEDVFDTWMTSSMSPEIAVKWLEKPSNFKKMFPMSLRPQSHDIIRTWAFYTILKAYLHFKKIPWRDIAIGTYVLDSKGKGMHKSKGNVIWTHQLLDKYKSIDIIRYWAGTATFGEDLNYNEKDLVTGKRFLTKLWNASKLSINNLQDYKGENPKKLEVMDKWILLKLNHLIKDVTNLFLEYKVGKAKRLTEQFFWHLFCDHYLEIIKHRLYDKKIKIKRESAQYTLYNSLLSLLKLFSPITPHITEELYQVYFKNIEKDKSIHLTKWPKYDKKLEDKNLEKNGELFVKILSDVRQFKTKNKKSLKEPIKLTLNKKDKIKLKGVLEDLKAVTNAVEIKFANKFKIEF